MKLLAFSKRNVKEILRDPINIVFGVGFPVILILMISFMKSSIQNVPSDLFPIESFAPGMAVFGLSFLTLFLGVLISGDRSSSFLTRIFASPLSGTDFIMGYSIPLIPIAVLQGIFCFLTASFFGLEISLNLLLALLVLIPSALLFISIGLLLGSLLSYRQVGGVGSIIVNLAAWLSGTWFSLELMGGAFKEICYALPFAHAVDSVKYSISGDYDKILIHLLWVISYAVVFFVLSILIFKKKMKD